MPELTIISWRDIPAQVLATDGAATVRVQLPDRFQLAIDAAAMRAGLVGSDEYLEEWRRESRPCNGDLERAVAEQAARLEEEFTADVLRTLVGTGGTRSPA